MHSKKEELIKFCERTSVRGVSRIVTSSSKCLQGMWLIVVIATLSMLCYFTGQLFAQYFKHEVQISIREMNLFNVDQYKEAKHAYGLSFPDVTLCNLNYLAEAKGNSASHGPAMTQQDFFKLLSDTYFNNSKKDLWKQAFETQPFSEDVYDHLWRHMFDTGFLPTIGRDRAEEMAIDIDNFVVSCDVHVYGHVDKEILPCNRAAIITPVITSTHFKCFTITPNVNRIETAVYGVTAVLYLETDQQNLITRSDFHKHPVVEEIGARVLISNRGVYPDSSRGTDVAPGQHTTFHLEFSNSQRLSEPYGNCHDQDDLDLYSIQNKSTSFEIKNSYYGCFQKYVLEMCGCITIKSPLNLGPWPENHMDMPVCEEVHFGNLSKSLKSIKCTLDIFTKMENICSKFAVPSCAELLFSQRLSHTNWPHPVAVLPFHTKYIANKPYASRFNKYHKAITRMQQKQMINYSFEDETYVLYQNMIQNNFVKVSVLSSSSRFMVYKSIPSMSITVLMSNLGGSFNLYAGISIIFVFEIAEFIFRLLLNRKTSVKRNK